MIVVSKDIGYPNGDPRNALGKALGVALRPEAAGALLLLALEFYAVFGVRLVALEGMRNLERQNFYWNRYVNRLKGWTVAAIPGTSMHGWGLAIDFGGAIQSSAIDMHRWLAANAPRFGWEWTGRDFGEPWHLDYTGINVTAAQRADYITRGLGSVITEGFLPMVSETDQKKLVDNSTKILDLLLKQNDRLDRLERHIADTANVRAFNQGNGIELVSTTIGNQVGIQNTTYYRLYEQYGMFSGKATDIPLFLLAHYRELYKELGNVNATEASLKAIVTKLDEVADSLPDAAS